MKPTENSTIGVLTVGNHTCATLEDAIREEKVYGETAIPAGLYELKLRNRGGMTSRYKQKYPDMHEGMIWLQDVPGYSWVYLHVGNYPHDTLGCILLGERASTDMVLSSRKAYKRMYPKIVKMIKTKGCQIRILDVGSEDG
jgi:hypothetical protein